MQESKHIRAKAGVVAVAIVAIIALLVVYAPLVAAILFVTCLTFLAVAVGVSQGFRKGLLYFLKEIFFGW